MATAPKVTPVVNDVKVTKLFIKPYHHHIVNPEHKEKYCDSVKIGIAVEKPKKCTMNRMYTVDVNGQVGHYCPHCTNEFEKNYEANKPKTV